MEIMNRFMLETVSHENEFKLLAQFKAMIQTKMAQKQRQAKMDDFFKPATDITDRAEEVEDDVSAVDIAAGDVSDEPVPELDQCPEDCNRKKKLSSIFAQMTDEQAEDAPLQARGVPEGVGGTAAAGAHRGSRPTAAFGHGQEDLSTDLATMENLDNPQHADLPEDAGDGQVHAADAQQGDRESPPALLRPLQLPPGGRTGDRRTRNRRKR